MLDLTWCAAYDAPPTMPAGTATPFHVALAVHVATIVMTLGAIFARPFVFAIAGRQDPRSLPLLHRIEYTVERYVMLPGVLVVIASGAYLAHSGEHWSAFYVWWGIAVVILLGVALPAIIIPTARRAELVAARDLLRGAESTVLDEPREQRPREPGMYVPGPDVTAVQLSGEYRALARRLALTSAVFGLLVLVTMLFMGVERPL